MVPEGQCDKSYIVACVVITDVRSRLDPVDHVHRTHESEEKARSLLPRGVI
jgi:hypothetical protein